MESNPRSMPNFSAISRKTFSIYRLAISLLTPRKPTPFRVLAARHSATNAKIGMYGERKPINIGLKAKLYPYSAIPASYSLVFVSVAL